VTRTWVISVATVTPDRVRLIRQYSARPETAGTTSLHTAPFAQASGGKGSLAQENGVAARED
jgi:hypothetical protein